MTPLNEALQDEFVTFTANLRRLSTQEANVVLHMLLNLRDELVAFLRDNDELSTYRRARTEALIQQATDVIKNAYTGIEESVLVFNTGIAELSALTTTNTFSTLRIPLQTVALTTNQYRALASDALINGAPSRDWWAKQSSNLQAAFTEQIRMGYLSGESIDAIVRRVRGTATGKRHVYELNGHKKTYVEYAGGIMDIGTRQAQALVRTSVQQVAADAKMNVLKENESLLKGMQWVSTLDNRTTLLCATRDGKMYTIEGKPMGHNLSYLTGPPAHWNCRSTMVPITKSWDELTKDPTLDTLFRDIPEGTRASMDGQVPASKTFSQWFDNKDAEFKKAYLGPTRYDMYRKGELRLQDMIAADGQPLPITKLRQKIGS